MKRSTKVSETLKLPASIRGFMEIYAINTGVRLDIFSLIADKALAPEEIAKKDTSLKRNHPFLSQLKNERP